MARGWCCCEPAGAFATCPWTHVRVCTACGLTVCAGEEGGEASNGVCHCQGAPTPSVDRGTGCVVCVGCGVVVENFLIDESLEYASEPRAGGAPVAAAPASETLQDGLRTVESFAHALRFSSATGVVLARAKELFADVHAVRTVRRDARDAYAAAALYLACKLEAAAREMAAVAAACGVQLQAVNAAVAAFRERLAGKPYAPRLVEGIRAGDLINATVDRVSGLSDENRRRVKRVAHRLDDFLRERLDCSRAPRTVCSGLIWVAMQRENVPAPKAAVLRACEVCAQTLDKVSGEVQRCLLRATRR